MDDEMTLEAALVNIVYISLLPSADLNSSAMAPVTVRELWAVQKLSVKLIIVCSSAHQSGAFLEHKYQQRRHLYFRDLCTVSHLPVKTPLTANPSLIVARSSTVCGLVRVIC